MVWYSPAQEGGGEGRGTEQASLGVWLRVTVQTFHHQLSFAALTPAI